MAEVPVGMGQEEQRLWLIRELAHVLARAQAALLAAQVEELEIQTARQSALCRALHALTHRSGNSLLVSVENLAPPCGEDGPPQGLKNVALQVRQLNRVQSALLRRARRSLAILASLRARGELTYALPGVHARGAVER